MNEQSQLNQSPEINELATALAKVQAEIVDAHKDQAGYGYKYADLGQVLQIVRPLLSKHGLSVSQFPCRSAQPGHVALTTMLMHTSGQWLQATAEVPATPGKGMSAAQGVGSGLSYLRRYSLAAVVGITQTDDDAQLTQQSAPTMTSVQNSTRHASKAAPIGRGDKATHLADLLAETGTNFSSFAEFFNIQDVEDMPEDQYERALAMLLKKRSKADSAAA